MTSVWDAYEIVQNFLTDAFDLKLTSFWSCFKRGLHSHRLVWEYKIHLMSTKACGQSIKKKDTEAHNLTTILPLSSSSPSASSRATCGWAFTSKFLLSQLVCSKEEPATFPTDSRIFCVTSCSSLHSLSLVCGGTCMNWHPWTVAIGMSNLILAVYVQYKSFRRVWRNTVK